jgi:hypothetical protein
MAITTDELLSQVRSQMDEENTTDLTDPVILQALNRGQQKLVRLAGRRYAPIFKREVELTGDGTREFTIPEQAFGLVVNEVVAVSGGVTYPVEPAELRQMTEYDNDSTTSSIPLYYAQVANKLRLYPTPRTGTTVRIRYQVRPPELVKSQGRITTVDVASNRLYLDALGSDLTTNINALKAFINVVDGTTGLVKVTLQVNGIDEDNLAITHKTTGLDRVTVFGQTVAVAIPTTGDTTVNQDDYVCIANGTAVPTLLQDYYDYLVQYAVVELKRKTTEPSQEDYAALKELEDDVKSMWAGREATRRVEKRSPYWGRRLSPLQRYR